MTLTINVATEDGEDTEERDFPARFEVCDTCEGRGTHVNPSIDSHGIGAEEWDRDWDDDDREGYLNGRYDVRCAECGGERVVPVLDDGRVSPEDLKLVQQAIDGYYQNQYDEDYERRMGC